MVGVRFVRWGIDLCGNQPVCRVLTDIATPSSRRRVDGVEAVNLISAQVFTLCWYCGNSSFRLPRSFGAESSERLSTAITSMASSARK